MWKTVHRLTSNDQVVNFIQQHFQHTVFTIFFRFTSFFGSDIGTTLVYLFLLLNVDRLLAVSYLCLFSITLIICNTMKEHLCLPRPNCIRLEKEFESDDFGCPSLHSATATVLGCWIYTSLDNWIPGPVIIAISTSICIGRLYLGCHSVVDVLAGIGVGLQIIASWSTTYRLLHYSIEECSLVATAAYGLFIAIGIFSYPTKIRGTIRTELKHQLKSSFGEVLTASSSSISSLFCMWISNCQLKLYAETELSPSHMFSRWIIAVVCTAANLIFLETIFKKIFYKYHTDPKSAVIPGFVKFLTGFFLVLLGNVVIPILLDVLGL